MRAMLPGLIRMAAPSTVTAAAGRSSEIVNPSTPLLVTCTRFPVRRA